MHVVGGPLAQKIAAVVQPGSAKNLIDVGGASGTYTIAFLRAAPEMKATLFDRATVIPIARERLIETGLLDRVSLAAGNFYEDELPGGHDLALLSAIIHQNSPAENIELSARCFVPWFQGAGLLSAITSWSLIEPCPGRGRCSPSTCW